MHLLIAGGSGFLGRALSSALLADGHRVQILSRRPPIPLAPGEPGRRRVDGSPARAEPAHQPEHLAWTPDGTLGPWAAACAGADIVINLAGESIGTARWTPARKAQLLESRVLATRSLVRFARDAARPPSTFISASAIGYYGDRGDATLAEDERPGRDFLADLAASWEKEALAAQGAGTRVALLRTGIVLDPREGALAKMITPFRLFAGGPFGSGRQFMSWIHRDDWVSLVRWAIDTPGVRGPLNLTAPNPVTNAEFARALGRALHRPAFIPAPGFALKIILGEMAGPLLLFSQRVVPGKALAGGFRFAHPELGAALAELLQPAKSGV